MQKIFLFIMILLLMIFGKVSGQEELVNIGIYPSAVPNQLDIKIQPLYDEDGTRYLNNIQFTIKWPISSGIPMITGIKATPFNLDLQGPPLTNGGFYYQRYASRPDAFVSWIAADGPILAHTIDAHTCPVANFEIADDAFVKNINVNGAYYIEVNGSKFSTGAITPTNATIASCQQFHYHTIKTTGNWNEASTWNTSLNGTTWGTALTYPLSTDLTIKVENSHTVTANTSVPIDQFTIEAGGAVTVSSAVTLTNSGSASDFVINSNSTTSGSLRTSGTGSVSGPVTYNRYMRADNYQYFSSPVTGQTFSAWSPGRDKTVWEWKETTGTWNSSLAEASFNSGKGYSWGATGTAGTVPFTGTLTTSASVPVTSPYVVGAVANDGLTQYNNLALVSGRSRTDATWGAGGWNLLGNPFTSALNASTFITNNSASFDPNYKAVYVYAGAEGSTGTYYYLGVDGDNGAAGGWSEVLLGSSNLQVGQGFFVLARNNSASFSFTNAMQVHSTGIELKSAQTPSIPGILLKAKYGTNESSTLVIYNDQMTTGLDPGYDIGLLSSGQDVELFTALVKDNGFDFARQILPLVGYDKNVIPVGVNSPKGAQVIFSAFMIPVYGSTFYLEDRITGKFTDLSKDTYKVTLPEKTSGTGRFYIHAGLTTAIRTPLVNSNELGVRIWNSNHEISIEGVVSNKAIGAIYDMLGRKIIENRLSNSNLNTILVPADIKGVYLVKVSDQGKMTTQKVVF